jgi:hypothetical protein
LVRKVEFWHSLSKEDGGGGFEKMRMRKMKKHRKEAATAAAVH